MNNADLFDIRPAVDADYAFLKATWLRGLYYGDSWFSEIPKNIFMAHYSKYLDNLLTQSGARVLVACLKEDPNVIVGYAVLGREASTLHWVFVKSAFRGFGIARALVPVEVSTVTHLTKVGLSLVRKRTGIEFNPFAL